MTQPQRNSPCSCGSGKRYKHCCGALNVSTPQDATPIENVSLPQTQEEALRSFNAGLYPQAERLLHSILRVEPENAEALHLLGVIANRTGHPDSAAGLIARAIAINPQVSVYYLNLGNALLEQRRLDDAIVQYRKAISLRPDLAEAYLNLGFVLGEKGEKEDALMALRQAVSLKPAFAEAHYNLGLALQDLGRDDEATKCYEQAVSLSPSYADALLNLGVLSLKNERIQEALGYFDSALTVKPDFALAYYNRGKALIRLNKTNDSIAAMEAAIRHDPELSDAYHDLGVTLHNKGNEERALLLLNRALELSPEDPDVYYNLGNVLNSLGRFKDAAQSYRNALKFKPGFASAQMNLGGAYMALGLADEAVTHYERALVLDHELAETHSNALLALQYASTYTPAEIFEKHREFGRRHASALFKTIQPHHNEANPDRRLKVGILSPDFRNHSVAYFVEPLLAHFDHGQFEVYGYYSYEEEDDITQRFKAYCSHWVNIFEMTDDEAAEQIRQDGIDILVDVAGHTGNNRLLVFARKPAPIQVTWLGHPNTTGLETIDYRITDSFAEPVGMTEHLNTETLWRLPEVFCCYTPCAAKPERRNEENLVVRPPPLLRNGYVTFGCFNNISKVSPPVVALWSRLLKAIPSSKLMLEAHRLEMPDLQGELLGRFGSHGIGPERLILKGRYPAQQYVLYHEVDVALDPFPCVGGTTTFDALWMGVPVVTLAGKTFVSRMGVSLLSNLGLTELVAETEETYIEIAQHLVSDPDGLNALRLGLRERMERSPLMDAPRFVRNMEAAFRGMWQRWCRQQKANNGKGEGV